MERIAISGGVLLSLLLCFPCVCSAAEPSEPKTQLQKIKAFIKKVDAGNVFELVDALENPLFRKQAQATLLKIGAPATEPLIEKLDDTEIQNSVVIVETLGMLGPVAKESWPLLLKKSTTKDRELSLQITKSLVLNGADVVPTLIAGLEDPSSEIRSNAARLLSELGPLGDEAVPALRARLRTKGEKSLVRFWTLIALSNMGPTAEAALPELLNSLNTIAENERYLPAQALGHLGPSGRAAIPQLIKMLKDRNTVRNSDTAAEALVDIGVDAVPAILELLKDNGRDRRLRETGSIMLVQIGRPAVPHLLPLIAHSDAQIVERAAIVLLQIGEPAVAEMMALMHSSSNPDVQFTLAQILARIPSASGMAVPGLIVGLQHADPVRRMTAAQALVETGPAAISALPYLIQALQTDVKDLAQSHGEDFPNAYVGAIGGALMAGGEPAILPMHQAMLHDDETVRNVAIQVMAHLGRTHRSIVIPRMVGSLMVANPRLKEGALATLALIEPGRFLLARLGPKAIPALTEAVRFGSPQVRLRAAQALAMLGEPAVTSLVDCLNEHSLEIRLVSVQSLGAMKSIAEPAVPALIDALNVNKAMQDRPEIPAHIWQQYAQHVALALGEIGGSAVPSLIKVLQGEDHDMQTAAALALSRMGDEAAPAVDQLRQSIQQPEMEVRMAALAALNRIGPASIAAFPELLKLLKDKDSAYQGDPNESIQRLNYARALTGVLGRLGSDGIPVMLPMIQDPDEELRAQIAYALYKIRIKPEDESKIDPALQDQLIAALADKTLVVRVVAAKALAAQGNQAEAAIDALIESIRTSAAVITDDRFDKDIITAYLPSIVNALDEIGEASVEPLIEAAKEGDPVLEGVVAWALFRIDPDASQLVSLGEGTIPVLISALHVRQNGFAKIAAEALVEMGDPAAKALIKTIQEHRLGYLMPPSKTLAKMHEISASYLVEQLKNPDPFIRDAAARALGGPKPADPDNIPVSTVIDGLTEALKDENPKVRASAEHSLFWLDARLARELGIKDPGVQIRKDPLPPRHLDPLLKNPFAKSE